SSRVSEDATSPQKTSALPHRTWISSRWKPITSQGSQGNQAIHHPLPRTEYSARFKRPQKRNGDRTICMAKPSRSRDAAALADISRQNCTKRERSSSSATSIRSERNESQTRPAQQSSRRTRSMEFKQTSSL